MANDSKCESFLQMLSRIDQQKSASLHPKRQDFFPPIIQQADITLINWLNSDTWPVHAFVNHVIAHVLMPKDNPIEKDSARNNESDFFILQNNQDHSHTQFQTCSVFIMDNMVSFSLKQLKQHLLKSKSDFCLVCPTSKDKPHVHSSNHLETAGENPDCELFRQVFHLQEANPFKFYMNLVYYFEHKFVSFNRLKLVVLYMQNDYLEDFLTLFKQKRWNFHLLLVSYDFPYAILRTIPDLIQLYVISDFDKEEQDVSVVMEEPAQVDTKAGCPIQVQNVDLKKKVFQIVKMQL